MTQKIWFITGTSKGFGREWATSALERGDRVAATARSVEAIADLAERFEDRVLPLALDVDDRAAAFAAVDEAIRRFGRIDVVVNNAGYGHFGFVEELTEEDARDQLETNFFGALWVSQAVLPHLRARRAGHILQVSSIGGVTAFAGVGVYNASKWALEGLSQALAAEVAEFGVAVTIIEPGGFATDWAAASARHSAPLAEYDDARERAAQSRRPQGVRIGSPAATSAAVLRVVDADTPPLRLFLGSRPLTVAQAEYERRLAVWDEWSDVAALADA